MRKGSGRSYFILNQHSLNESVSLLYDDIKHEISLFIELIVLLNYTGELIRIYSEMNDALEYILEYFKALFFSVNFAVDYSNIVEQHQSSFIENAVEITDKWHYHIAFLFCRI
jgi:hypothetical protein